MNGIAFFMFCILLMAKNSKSEFQLQRMSSKHRQKASQLLDSCTNSINVMSTDIMECEKLTSEIWASTRCRTFNVYLEVAATRLEQLEIAIAARGLEVMKSTVAECKNQSVNSDDIEQLKAEAESLKGNLSAVEDAIRAGEDRIEEIRDKLDGYRNQSERLDCRLEQLEAELRHAQNSSAAQGVAQQLMAELAAARQQSEEECLRLAEQQEAAVSECRQRAETLAEELRQLREPPDAAEPLSALQERLQQCEAEGAACQERVEPCVERRPAELSRRRRWEAAAITAQGRLAGCRRELGAVQARRAVCLAGGRRLVAKIRKLSSQLRGSGSLARRLRLCKSESVRCDTQAGECALRRREVELSVADCREQVSEWEPRFHTCDTTANRLETVTLAPLKARAAELEEQVNATLQWGRECDEMDLVARADLSFAVEKLDRAHSAMVEATEQAALCGAEGCPDVPDSPETTTTTEQSAYDFQSYG